MKRFKKQCLAGLTLVLGMQPLGAGNTVFQNVENLLQRMTLEEKVGQMAQITLDVVMQGENAFSSYEPLRFDQAILHEALVDYHVGSILNAANTCARTTAEWSRLLDTIQNVAIHHTRLKIPVIYGVDAIHGVTYTVDATFFPQQIGQAAARNRDLTRRAAEITGYETRASGISWNFSPVLDLGADPRFSRQWEGFGEDPYIASELGAEMVRGYEKYLASCAKHFLGYGAPVSGKDRTPAYIPEEMLQEYHVPPFAAGINAGTRSIMINSGLINNVPVHSDYSILTRLLKEKLGFQGVVVSDWQDIENLYRRDKIAENVKEAICIAVNAGIDLSMVPYDYKNFCENLIALVKEGKVKQERIDDAVRRILTLKYSLDLFQTPVTYAKDYPQFGSPEFTQTAYQLAAESITLLKNENGILPLPADAKILLTGPNANSMRSLNGGWTYSWQGDRVEDFSMHGHTILEACQTHTKNLTYIPGVSYKPKGKYYEEYADRMEEVLAAAAQADVIVLCLGENSYCEKPGDLHDLYLSDLQTELAQKLAATGKPVVLVLNEGRPRIISKFEAKMKAVVQTYLPGNSGGDALADILWGKVNPSGKLPYTYPRFPNALIPYYHKPSEEQTKAEGAYNYEADYNPQYEFGFGLSYTDFEYSNLTIGKTEYSPDETIHIQVDITNKGQRSGKETVQLFTSDLYASVTPDIQRLRRFEKIELQPGETRTVDFTLTAKDLSFVKSGAQRIAEAGDFVIRVDGLRKKITFTSDKLF
ncbi:glycosyl hydrolase [Bacteroidia bacterium]|nr:glycosyl hydrolase [Bacteroidia bacterium]